MKPFVVPLVLFFCSVPYLIRAAPPDTAGIPDAPTEEAYETGKTPLTEMGIEKLEVGAQDGFRFIFFKADVPEFRSYRIRVLETR